MAARKARRRLLLKVKVSVVVPVHGGRTNWLARILERLREVDGLEVICADDEPIVAMPILRGRAEKNSPLRLLRGRLAQGLQLPRPQFIV